jgi:hypothetical protein
LTIANGLLEGRSVQGAGILNDGGTLTIDHATISDNVANAHAFGGATAEGGGIDNLLGVLTVRNSIITRNTASATGSNGGFDPFGGGIANEDTAIVLNSTVSDNISATSGIGGEGGGITGNGGTLTITGSSISHNKGGGIYNFFGALNVTSSTIAANYDPEGSAGGIWNAGPATIGNSTISGNQAGGSGIGVGGILNLGCIGGPVDLSNSTVSDNTGGEANQISTSCSNSVRMRNTILAGDGSHPNVSGAITSQGHNLNSDSSGSLNGPGDLLNTDPLLGPLADHGGPTPTQALLPGSPAIDAGDNTGAPMWDQRGPRFPRIEHGIIDIGAFEYHFPRQVQLDPNPVPVQGVLLAPQMMQPSGASAAQAIVQPQATGSGRQVAVADGLLAASPLQSGDLPTPLAGSEALSMGNKHSPERSLLFDFHDALAEEGRLLCDALVGSGIARTRAQH